MATKMKVIRPEAPLAPFTAPGSINVEWVVAGLARREESKQPLVPDIRPILAAKTAKDLKRMGVRV